MTKVLLGLYVVTFSMHDGTWLNMILGWKSPIILIYSMMVILYTSLMMDDVIQKGT